MKVKITKARSTYWYADKIGDVIEVVQCPRHADHWVPIEDNTDGKFITKDNCEVVVDPSIYITWSKNASDETLEGYLSAIQAELVERAAKPATDTEILDWMRKRCISYAQDMKLNMSFYIGHKGDEEMCKDITKRLWE